MSICRGRGRRSWLKMEDTMNVDMDVCIVGRVENGRRRGGGRGCGCGMCLKVKDDKDVVVVVVLAEGCVCIWTRSWR